MDVKSTNKIQKARIHNSVVERMTSVYNSAPVSAIDPINAVTNNTALISYNSLLSSDEFYDKLSKLQNEYRRFYHDQQELEKALSDMNENSDSLTEHMKELVQKYNIALGSLKQFDIQFNTNHRGDVAKLLQKFRRNLFNIGVKIDEGATLSFDEVRFTEAIFESNDAIKFLFRPIKGLIINLHREFKNINISEDEGSYYEKENISYNGMITDQKA